MRTAPTIDIDIFSDEVLDDPWPAFRRIRDAAPVVRLQQELYDVYALGRFRDVRAAMRDWHDFSSAEGIAFNEPGNIVSKLTVIGCDPPAHTQLRAVMMERLRLSEVRELTGMVQSKADALVERLRTGGEFDAVGELAEQLVPQVVGELIGVSGDLLQRFAADGEVIFTVLGPPNERMQHAVGPLMALRELVGGLRKDDMVPGSMGWDLYDAAERGEISQEMSAELLLNYVGPGFETTINAISTTIWLLASDGEAWKALKEDPSLVPSVVNESIRIESPLQVMARYCRDAVVIDDVEIPAGSRIALLIGSANRDERHYANPDDFDVHRNPIDHVGFGNGIHLCVGASLARAQLTAVLNALVQQVTTLECGEPVRRLTNISRGLAKLPASFS